MPKQKGRKSRQEKHKFSAFTAAENIKYRKYRNRQALKGKEALPKKKWKEKVHKPGS